MASKDIHESQQQSQNVTIGTQGNEDQKTPEGEGLNAERPGGPNDRHIPNQDKSSATNQQRSREQSGGNE